MDAEDFDAVSAAEVTKGVVGGDHDAAFFGNGSDDLLAVIVEDLKFEVVGDCVFVVGGGVGGIDDGELNSDGQDGAAPGGDIHPDVGIRVLAEVGFVEEKEL